MRTLPAAAIPAGAVVRVGVLLARDGELVGELGVERTITRVHNADPVAGRIRWETDGYGDVAVGGADRVEVLSLP